MRNHPAPEYSRTVSVTPPLSPQPLFKITEVAELTGVSKRSLYYAIRSGRIPADQVVRLGGLRIKRSYVCTVLDAHDDTTTRETVQR